MLFDTSTYQHQELFLGKLPWEVLAHLKGYFETLRLGSHLGAVSPQATIVHPELVYLGEGSVVAPGALIEGPCYIGAESRVGHGAYLRPYALIGDACVVGHASEVKHSIFLDGAKAPHFNYVGDSIVGNGVNLGAGVICANVRHDRGEVKVRYGGELVHTGLKKLGALLGDESQIGCNSVTNPGAIFPRGTHVEPCTSCRGGYAESAEASV